jgi:hypothetical protein
MSVEAECPECGQGFLFTGRSEPPDLMPEHRLAVWVIEHPSGRGRPVLRQAEPCPRSGLPWDDNPDRCPETGRLDCPMCSGERCLLCGAGIWHDENRPWCEHAVDERHTAPEAEPLHPGDGPAGDKVADLMAALERSVADAKAARARHRADKAGP